jgi:glutamate-1-semialdehyde aminotransferase
MMNDRRYSKSTKFLHRAEKSIPLGSQTFSKSRIQYPVGVSPLFIDKAHGTYVWDIDGNKYIDLVNSLAAVTVGYRNRIIDSMVRKQMKKGTIFSLPGKLETEVAELVIKTVPSAEMVRFAKNGSDATSAAIRLSRAYTNRDEIAICGYHGWQDWYIGSTTMNKGVPQAIINLSHTFKYNDINSLKNIFTSRPNKIAAVILEPMNSEYPRDNFLQEVKDLVKKNGSILIFDETITGYRYSTGGAQLEFGVTPDLTTLGKGIANGYPLSALTGKKEIMKELEKVFFSATFGGELLSLAAAKAVIQMHLDSNITTEIVNVGLKISSELEKIIQTYKMSKFLTVSGHPSWKFLNWSGNNEVDASSLKTYFMQEMFKKGILVLSTHNNSLSLTAKIADRVINTYGEVISDISKSLSDGSLLDKLQVDPVQPVIKLR